MPENSTRVQGGVERDMGDDQFQWLPWEEVKDLAALDEFYRLYPDKPGGLEECKRTGKGQKPLRRVCRA